MGRGAALFMNINAAKGLYEVMKTNYGPKGTIKMLVGGAGGEEGPGPGIEGPRGASGAPVGRLRAVRMAGGGAARAPRARFACCCAPRPPPQPDGAPDRLQCAAVVCSARASACACAAAVARATRPAALAADAAPPSCRRPAASTPRHQADQGRQRAAARDADPEPDRGHDRARGGGAGRRHGVSPPGAACSPACSAATAPNRPRAALCFAPAATSPAGAAPYSSSPSPLPT